jgi:hypothetical protein
VKKKIQGSLAIFGTPIRKPRYKTKIKCGNETPYYIYSGETIKETQYKKILKGNLHENGPSTKFWNLTSVTKLMY